MFLSFLLFFKEPNIQFLCHSYSFFNEPNILFLSFLLFFNEQNILFLSFLLFFKEPNFQFLSLPLFFTEPNILLDYFSLRTFCSCDCCSFLLSRTFYSTIFHLEHSVPVIEAIFHCEPNILFRSFLLFFTEPNILSL